jgi:hypothetical protein
MSESIVVGPVHSLCGMLDDYNAAW